MDLLKMELWVIKDKFPTQSARIDELYKYNEDFKSLCSDYILCKTSLEKFKEEYGEKKKNILDYQNAFNELEKELYDFVFSSE